MLLRSFFGLAVLTTGTLSQNIRTFTAATCLCPDKDKGLVFDRDATTKACEGAKKHCGDCRMVTLKEGEEYCESLKANIAVNEWDMFCIAAGATNSDGKKVISFNLKGYEDNGNH